jgi:hypothetical protein
MRLRNFWLRAFAILSARGTFKPFRVLDLHPKPALHVNLASLDARQNPGREIQAAGQQIVRSEVGVRCEASVNFSGR